MRVKLVGVHPASYDSEVKEELQSLEYPAEVEIEWDGTNYYVGYPTRYKAHAAWFQTNNPELNNWTNNFWNNATESTDTEVD